MAADKTSVSRIFLGGIIVSSTLSIGLAFSSSYFQLAAIMVMTSCVQGCGWVPATKLIGQWFDDSKFATMFSILGCASTVAGLLLSVCKRFYWRTIELNLGILVLLFALICKFSIGDESKNSNQTTKEHGKQVGLRDIVKSKVVWHIGLIYFFSMEMRTISETWIPLYLQKNNGNDDGFQVFYELGGMIGGLFSGLAIDMISVKYGVDKSRRIVGIICTVLMMLTAGGVFQYPVYATYLGFITGFFVNGSINAWCLIGSQCGSSDISGTCSAFISFIATSGSIFAGSPLANLMDLYGFGVFVTVFMTQIVIVLTIAMFNIPLRMDSLKKNV